MAFHDVPLAAYVQPPLTTVRMPLAEMAVRSGVGFTAARLHDHADLFSEGVGGIVICASAENAPEVLRRCDDTGVATVRLGVAGGDRLVVKGLLDVA